MARRQVSERVERSPAGRLVISAAIVLVLLVQVATHLPPSALDRALAPTANRVIRMLGIEQAWGVFAPDPRATSLELEARVTFADGSTATWEVPQGPVVGANLRYYRWRKWLERIRSDDFRGLWRPTAAWVASLYDDAPSPVAQVQLVRRFHENAIAGDQPPWQEHVFYTLDLAPADALERSP